MSLAVRWITHVGTSSLHAAEALLREPTLVDPKLTAAIREPGWDLAQEIAVQGWDEIRYWRQLLCMAHQFENKRQLAQIALFRAFGTTKPQPENLAALAGRLTDLQLAYNRAFPEMANELALRSRPLREQWEARAPGLLRTALSLTEDKILVPGVDILLVQPALGGYGVAQLYNNTVRIEAMLANPHDRLPEVVRLAWMVLQLNLDLPMFSEEIHGERLPMIAGLAMLPLALHAAQEVELARFDFELLQLALTAWRVPQPRNISTAEVVANWWDVFHTTNTTIRVGLKALDEMLTAENNEE